MRWNIITNLTNSVGLQRDYEIIKVLLESCRHVVRGVQFNCPQNIQLADRNLFLEVLVPHLFRYAREQWVVPNSEWWFPEWNRYLPSVRLVLAKTRDAQRIFSHLAGEAKTHYVGWKSRDLYDESAARLRRFLHLAGKSQTKNTEAILEAWRDYQIPVPLTVISENYARAAAGIPNITHLGRIAEPELVQIMNSHLYHLCPSKYEGWGHYIHEALGVGAVVLTTDAPPMNEFGCPRELAVPVLGTMQHHAATLCNVSPQGIFEAAKRALSLTEERIGEVRAAARQYFLGTRETFDRLFMEVCQA